MVVAAAAAAAVAAAMAVVVVGCNHRVTSLIIPLLFIDDRCRLYVMHGIHIYECAHVSLKCLIFK